MEPLLQGSNAGDIRWVALLRNMESLSKEA